MQHAGEDSAASLSSSASAAQGGSSPSASQPAAPTSGASRASQSSAPASRKLAIHPLWLAIGAAALFALIFGVGALTGTGSTSGTSSAPSGTQIEQTTIDVIHRVDPSIVQVQARGLTSGGGVGSGEILTPSGYIVTNSHVVHGFSRYTVLLSNGQTVPAQLVGDVPSEDLAVLKINAPNLRPIAVGDSSKVQVGESAIAMGSPLGLEQSATSGIVSALNRQANEVVDDTVIQLSGMIQTSAPINPGNSGGALVNLRGELIGIPTLGLVEPSSGVAASGIGFAISSNRMKAIVSQLSHGAA